MNYFIEGLQGSGKSTLVERLSRKLPDYQVIHEGDYSPVELAWCAYVSGVQYDAILKKYKDIQQEIEAKSHEEEERKVICYTQIITDIAGFHKDLEQYEIYNGRVPSDEFKRIIESRFEKWQGDKTIFECSLFQNIVEDMLLFHGASDWDILLFYEDISKVLRDKDFHILYLESGDISSNINVIRKERSDDQGNELWFPMMCAYFNESPYAKEHGLSGEEGLLKHLAHRQELELSICREVFPDRCTVLPSKQYEYPECISGKNAPRDSIEYCH